MATYQVPGSAETKLPLITGRNSLVSPTQSERKHKQEGWAVDIRNRLSSKEKSNEKISESEIQIFRGEVAALFVTALQKDDRGSWSQLRDVLPLVQPWSHLLTNKHDLSHYLERIIHHLEQNKGRLFDLHVLDAINKVFPKELVSIKESGSKPSQQYCPPTPPQSVAGPTRKHHARFILPDGKNPYLLEQPGGAESYKPKGLTLCDLRASIPDVALEMATREAIWSACLGNTALFSQLPEMDEPEETDQDIEPESPPVSSRLSPDPSPRPALAPITPRALLSGRQAVEYFTKCYHNGKIKYMYFNSAPSRHFRPYDLVEVPKDKVNPEHFVFSTFGVLHVVPNEPNENQSLTEWQRDAVLFKAISAIPFFKNYLLTKMFRRWHSCVQYLGYCGHSERIENNLLPAVPAFGAALQQVARLCADLHRVALLPIDNSKCYEVLEFENAVNYINLQAEKVLERFYRYNSIIVDTTSQESYKKLRHAQQQVKHKTVFSKESLHLQRKKKEHREENLRKAKRETERLWSFARLVDQMLLCHLVQLARHCVTTFIHRTLEDPAQTRDGFFKANLIFGSQDQLSISPSKEKLTRVMSRTLSDIPNVLCDAAVPMDSGIQAAVTAAATETSTESPQPSNIAAPSSSRVVSIKDLMRDPKKRRPASLSHRSLVSDMQTTKTEAKSTSDAHSFMATPEMPKLGMASKSTDDMGIATPEMMEGSNVDEEEEQNALSDLITSTRSSQTLTKANLQEKLQNDEAYQHALEVQSRLNTEAMKEIDDYCEKNAWLTPIYQYCQSWTEHSLQQWKGAQAFNIEQKLNELRQWSEKVRNFDRSYQTDNGLLHINCSGVHDYLLPKLNDIFTELCGFVADEAAGRAQRFCTEMEEVLENMKDKQTNIGGFAVYAKNVAKYKQTQPKYRERVEYVKSLFEVIRMSYRQLSPEEEKLEETVLAKWDAFLVHMQDAYEFVNTQTPLITQNLDDSYQPTKEVKKEKEQLFRRNQEKLEREAHALCEEATTGVYLDPTHNPSVMLKQLRRIREKFSRVDSEMQQASRWKEAITGTPYDLAFLRTMAKQIDIRHELWKYVEITTHEIKEWRGMLFKKLNCRKAVDKLTEWVAAAGQMKQHLPVADQVLAHWFRMLQDFKQHLPILHKLSNDALKVRHWKVIFLGMGESYEPETELTVEQLLSYNLAAHTNTILDVYAAAVAEFAIEQKLTRIKKLWQEREFKLAKHIPDSIYKDDSGGRGRGSPQPPQGKMKRFEKFRLEKAGANQARSLDLRPEQLFIVIEVDELKYLLQDSRLSVASMLTSPFLAEQRGEAEQWGSSLAEIEEILDLWTTCQTHWLFLLKIFEDPDSFRRIEAAGTKFESVHIRFTELMQAIVSDARVTSVVTRPRGDKEYRFHQGEKLRNLLATLIQQQEEVLVEVESVIEQGRQQFPRLYFLSQQEMVALLSVSRNPQALMPFAQKCFTGIESLSFALPTNTNAAAINSALDYALNAHKLEVTAVHGSLGEVVPLQHRVEATSAPKWLAALELSLKTTMLTVTEAALLARLDPDSRKCEPVQLLEELQRYEESGGTEVEELAAEIKGQFSHWLLRFPAQCVLTAEAVMWEKSVFRALERQDREELQHQRQLLVSRMDQYVTVLRDNSQTVYSNDMRQRLHTLLGNLVNQGLYHRDVMDKLLSHSSLSDGAFDWLTVLKYHMEIRTVLRAKTDSGESETGQQTPEQKPQTARPAMDKAMSFDDLSLPRSVTQVSTGYQFGQCVVSQLGATFAYDQEYLGPSTRLVLTPLTERAYLTLTTALRNFHCGTLIGPAGTGKTETIKDLAKALGRHLVVVNSSDGLLLPQMNQYLNGMIQSGSWALFDDTDRMQTGLLSVFGQQLDYVSNALHVLDNSMNNQYGIRGQPRFDKKMATKSGEKKIRRNSLTTLHSLPPNASPVNGPAGLERQTTVPHGFNEEGLITYFEDPWVKERERRHSIEKEIEIKESELYKSVRPPPLFYEHVTLHRKPKPDYKDLIRQYVPYKPRYIGNILFNGKLVKANANYGCFMTLNTANVNAATSLPDNLRIRLRPCALVVPDVRVVLETRLYCAGFTQYSIMAAKLGVFFSHCNTQLSESGSFGLGTISNVVHVAAGDLHSKLQEMLSVQKKQHKKAAQHAKENPEEEVPAAVCSLSISSYERKNLEESCMLTAMSMVLKPRMTSPANSTRLASIIRDVFPSSSRPKSGIHTYPSMLVVAIEEQMRQDNMQAQQGDFVDKVLQLYSSLEKGGKAVVLSGQAGSGKTSLYRVLAKVLTRLATRSSASVGKLDEELVPERSLATQHAHKLKILSDAEARPEAAKQPAKWQKAGLFTSIAKHIQSYATSDDANGAARYPKVDVTVLYPNALTPEQLYGGMSEHGVWQRGILESVMNQCHTQATASANAATKSAQQQLPQQQQQQQQQSKHKKKAKGSSVPAQEGNIHTWLVLDGELNPAWTDSINSLLDETKTLSLPSAHSIKLADRSRLLLEVSDLQCASPATLARCSLMHCGASVLPWKALIESWENSAKQRWVLNTSSLQVLQSLIASTFGVTLSFLSDCLPALLGNVDGRSGAAMTGQSSTVYVQSFLNILSALLDRHFSREQHEQQQQQQQQEMADANAPAASGAPSEPSKHSSRLSSIAHLEDGILNYMTKIKSMFAFAYIWGFGGGLHDSCLGKFSTFARDTLGRAAQPVHIPTGGSVYDYYVDCKKGALIRWAEKGVEKTRNLPANYVVIPETDRYHFLVDLLLSVDKPTMLVGEPGVGKSSMAMHLIQSKHPLTRLICSPGLLPSMLQQSVLSRLNDSTAAPGNSQKPDILTSRGGGQSGSNSHLFFLDDLHAAPSDGKTGSQPLLELVREMISEGNVYDQQRYVTQSTEKACFLAATTNPGAAGSGYGRASHPISARVTRLFTVLAMHTPDTDLLHSIYTKTLLTWLEEFPTLSVQHHAEFARALVQSSLDIFAAVKEKLHTSPAHPHYIFSLHDIAKTLDGIMLMSPRQKIRPVRKKKQTELGRVKSASSTLKDAPPMMRVIARLWCHESTRIFGDRILTHEDSSWFESLLEETVIKNLCTGAADWQEQMSVIQEDSLSQVEQISPGGGPAGATPPPVTTQPPSTPSSTTTTPHPVPSETTSSSEATNQTAVIAAENENETETETDDAMTIHEVESSVMQVESTVAMTEDSTAETPYTTDNEGGSDDDSDSSSSSSSSSSSDSDEDLEDEESRPTSTDSSHHALKGSSRSKTVTSTLSKVSESPELSMGTSSQSKSRTMTVYSTAGKGVVDTVVGGEKHKKPTVVIPPALAGSRRSLTSQSPSGSSLNKSPSKSKRGVTFKAGLLADREVETYQGPLLSMEQICEPGESVTGFVFTKYILGVHAEMYNMAADKGYVEVSRPQLSEALYSCLAAYNKQQQQHVDVVFFREAAEHVARLSRVLALPGGHALLLGSRTGRATLVRVAATAAHAKLFEPKVQAGGLDNRRIVHEHLKRLSRTAALHGKQTVLLLNQDMGEQCIQDVTAFMKQGTCPGLYSTEEIQNIATAMTPGQVKITRADKIEAAFTKYITRVTNNLHVCICLDYSASRSHSLAHLLSMFPSLLTSVSHVDLYHPWNHDAYISVAEYCLKDTTCKLPVSWSGGPEQMNLVATAMAYIHMSSRGALEKLHSHQPAAHSYNFFTPLTYMEFVHVYKLVAAHIAKVEQEKMGKYDSGLSRINEAFDSIATYKSEVSELVPKQRMSQATVQDHVQNVELQREDYIKNWKQQNFYMVETAQCEGMVEVEAARYEQTLPTPSPSIRPVKTAGTQRALDHCREEEELIERMMSPLENLKQEAQSEFNKVNPTYQAARVALESLDKNSLEEIKSYRVPPEGVIIVLKAVCLLFGRPQSWEEGKSLLMKDNIFEELEFYDKNNIPDDMFEELGRYYDDPDFEPDVVQRVSEAAMALCLWVRAIYLYADISRNIKPKIQELQDAEAALNKAQAILGEKRVEANRIKSSLEKEIKAHREAVQTAKTIDKQIQTIEKRISKANHLMENMSSQHTLWRAEHKSARSKLRTAPGDALLTAAAVCYHGPLDNRTRAQLMNDWLARCEVANFDPQHRMGVQIKQVSLSAKLESLLKPSASDSVHSIQPTDVYQPEETATAPPPVSASAGNGGDRPASRASSTASSMPQLSVYKHRPSVYDTGITFKTEVRVLENIDGHDTESIGASSVSSKNLLAVRDSFTLQTVLSSFEELSEWQLAGLPTDVYSIHNALIMRITAKNRHHCWPLLVDPDGQAELWVTTLQNSTLNSIDENDLNQYRMPEETAGEHRPLTQETAFTTQSGYTMNSTEVGTQGSTTIESRSHTARTGGVQSYMTEDIMALTSVTHSAEAFTGQLMTDITDRPENNLWVVEADDPELETRIINAVVHGLAVLVTHLERRMLDPLFRGLLLKHFAVNEQNERVLKIGDNVFPYHPKFALYLSTSVPLFLKGAGIHELPVDKLCVIDLAHSQEAIINNLLYITMAIERPEYEAQRKSIEADIIHHKDDLNQQQEKVLQKTMDMSVALLEERTMLDALHTCQRNVDRNQLILEEARYLRQHLEEKREPYQPVAEQGAKLYELCQRGSVLNSMYCLRLEAFMKLVKDVLQERHRGKGSTGAPKARAQELINAITCAVYQRVSSMMYQPHGTLFALLLTLERLRMDNQLTNTELGLFVNGVDTSAMEDTMVFEDKPHWITNKVWLDCAALETTMSVFRSLRDSLSKNTRQWQEYFKYPVELMTPLPDERLFSLSVFHKCILWRIIAAHKLGEVCDKLIVYELGGLLPPPQNYNIRNVYEQADKSVPVLLLLPSPADGPDPSTRGECLMPPSQQVLSLAKDVGMEGRVHVVTCGVSSQMGEVKHALTDCVQQGYWLVIQNAHLAHTWSNDILQIIKRIVHSGESEEERPSSTDSSREDEHEEEEEESRSGSRPVTAAAAETMENKVHKNFRLWVITRTDTGAQLPGYLIQYGLKTTCELSNNFKDTFMRTYQNIEKLYSKRDKATAAVRKIYGQYSQLQVFALLHSVLLQRRMYGDSAMAEKCHWNQGDVNALLDQCRIILMLCQRHRGVCEMSSLLYGGHCLDVQDRKVITALAETIIRNPKQLNALSTQSENGVEGVDGLLQALVCATSVPLEERLAHLTDVTATSLGLPSHADANHYTQNSSILVQDLVRVIGAPDTTSPDQYLRRAEINLQKLLPLLEGLDVPKTDRDAFYPLDMLWHLEADTWRSMLAELRAECMYLLQVTKGGLATSPDAESTLRVISKGQVPLHWTRRAFPTSLPLLTWAKQFKHRLSVLTSYTSGADKVVCFDMSVLHRPDRFVQAILQTYVRKEFKDLHACTLDAQFMPVGLTPSGPPDRGCFLSGLYLHHAGWDGVSVVAMDTPSAPPVAMPIIWLKPTLITELNAVRAQQKVQLYDCPLYSTAEPSSWRNIMASVELPSVRVPARQWAVQRVYMTARDPTQDVGEEEDGEQ